MTSVSEVDWKIAPWRTSSSRSSLALTRLPLWPMPNWPVRAVDEHRLGVLDAARPGRRVADVADGDVADQRGELGLVEAVVDLAHRPRQQHPVAVGARDARALLSAMLQRVEAEVGEIGRLGMPEDAEDATLVAEFVHVSLCCCRLRRRRSDAATPPRPDATSSAPRSRCPRPSRPRRRSVRAPRARRWRCGSAPRRCGR